MSWDHVRRYESHESCPRFASRSDDWRAFCLRREDEKGNPPLWRSFDGGPKALFSAAGAVCSAACAFIRGSTQCNRNRKGCSCRSALIGRRSSPPPRRRRPPSGSVLLLVLGMNAMGVYGETARRRYGCMRKGALVGTSEMFIDVRADGSYFDPSVGRRVAPANAE